MNNIIKNVGLAALGCAAIQPICAKSAAPNILFIIIDDLGIKDLGCYGNTMNETPKLDHFATQGMQFSQAYASPVSSATRTSILSGQNTARHGVWEVIGCHDRPYAKMKSPKFNEELPEEIETYADILTDKGYNCALFGKWHAGRTPKAEGFGGCDIKLKSEDLIKHAKANTLKQTGMITAKSIEFLRENKDKPFFLCVSHNLVHAPLEAPKALDKKYCAKIRKTGNISFHPQYLSMVEMVDTEIGMVLDEVDKLGLDKNTAVVIISDNGGLESDLILSTPLAGCNDPYRSQKGDLYEGGIHIPMMVRWAGKVEAGSKCDEVVTNIDLFSTFLEMGKAKAPANQANDGVSLVPLITGKVDKLDREAVYWHFPTNMWTRNPMGAIRKGNYKLIENFLDGRIELYDVVNDIGEVVDLASTRPDIAADLLADLHKWQKDINAGMPTPNPNYDPLREREMAKDWWK
ncbi:MAG: sulfatase [Rikenellaceae bacterium]